MYAQFTWFDKITRIYEAIEGDEDRAAFAKAVIEFGAMGREPMLRYPLNAFFESVREDITNSINARANNKGGRPKKQGVSERSDETETGGFETGKTGGFAESETSENPSLYKPKPKPKPKPMPKPKKTHRARFAAPTESEFCDFAISKGASPEKAKELYCYYDSQGWRKANGLKLVNWKTAVSGAIARDKARKGVPDAEYSQAFGA